VGFKALHYFLLPAGASAMGSLSLFLKPLKVGGHNERAYITKAEMAAMKVWGAPGIFLLGFVHKDWLKPW